MLHYDRSVFEREARRLRREEIRRIEIAAVDWVLAKLQGGKIAASPTEAERANSCAVRPFLRHGTHPR